MVVLVLLRVLLRAVDVRERGEDYPERAKEELHGKPTWPVVGQLLLADGDRLNNGEEFSVHPALHRQIRNRLLSNRQALYVDELFAGHPSERFEGDILS